MTTLTRMKRTMWCIAACVFINTYISHVSAVETTAHTIRVTPSASSSSSFPIPTPPPFTLDDKKRLCQYDFQWYNRMLKLMHVTLTPPTTPATNDDQPTDNHAIPVGSTTANYPRIFCYVNTISSHHKSHAQLVADTWAQRCDKTVFFSNDTGTFTVNKGTPHEISFPILKMNAPADYWHLWMKHKESLKYIYDHYRHDYDWFYKADDDAYIVVDNLRAYLRRPEIMMNYKRQPMQLGKRFNRTLDSINPAIRDKKMREEWWSRWDRWIFNSGGSGYAMNRLYLDTFVASMHTKKCFSDRQTEPEDTSTAFCMMWHDVVPWDTRDFKGRPRWHASSPGSVYGMTPEVAKGYWYDMHNNIGGFKWGEDCCARDSIGFHYVKGEGMHHVERMLYYCRTDDDVVDIADYNRKFNLSTSYSILDYKPTA